MPNYTTNQKPPTPASVYPGLVAKIARAGLLIAELQKEIGFQAIAGELGVSPQAIQQKAERIERNKENAK